MLTREGVVQLNAFGTQLGFGASVFRERQFFQGEAGALPTPDAGQPILTWPFLDFLDHLDLRAESLIELGAGYSIAYRGESWVLVDFAGKRAAFLKLANPNRPSAIVLDKLGLVSARRGAAHATRLPRAAISRLQVGPGLDLLHEPVH